MKVLIPVNHYSYLIDDPQEDISSLKAWWRIEGRIPNLKSPPAFELIRGGFCKLNDARILKIKQISVKAEGKDLAIYIAGNILDPEKGKVEKMIHSFPVSRISPFCW